MFFPFDSDMVVRISGDPIVPHYVHGGFFFADSISVLLIRPQFPDYANHKVMDIGLGVK